MHYINKDDVELSIEIDVHLDEAMQNSKQVKIFVIRVQDSCEAFHDKQNMWLLLDMCFVERLKKRQALQVTLQQTVQSVSAEEKYQIKRQMEKVNQQVKARLQFQQAGAFKTIEFIA